MRTHLPWSAAGSTRDGAPGGAQGQCPRRAA